jgi:hypothetical protein
MTGCIKNADKGFDTVLWSSTQITECNCSLSCALCILECSYSLITANWLRGSEAADSSQPTKADEPAMRPQGCSQRFPKCCSFGFADRNTGSDQHYDGLDQIGASSIIRHDLFTATYLEYLKKKLKFGHTLSTPPVSLALLCARRLVNNSGQHDHKWKHV